MFRNLNICALAMDWEENKSKGRQAKIYGKDVTLKLLGDAWVKCVGRKKPQSKKAFADGFHGFVKETCTN